MGLEIGAAGCRKGWRERWSGKRLKTLLVEVSGVVSV